MTARIDWPRLITALDIAQELHGGLSDRALSERIGLSPSAICRLRAGKALSADGLAKLVAWLYPASRPTWIAVEPAPYVMPPCAGEPHPHAGVCADNPAEVIP